MTPTEEPKSLRHSGAPCCYCDSLPPPSACDFCAGIRKPPEKDPAAVALGRKGGLVKSAAKTKAAGENARKRWANKS